jgi:1-deoxy-D-xylulose-5-phosphate synthase
MATEEGARALQKRELGVAEILKTGKEVAIIALGHMCDTALQVAALLAKEGIDATVIDPIFVKPLDTDLFCEILLSHPYIVTLEEHSLNAGLGAIFNSFIIRNGFTPARVFNFGIPDTFVEQGSNKELLQELGLTPELISKQILKELIPHTAGALS